MKSIGNFKPSARKAYNRQANRENALTRGSWFSKRLDQAQSPKRYTSPLSSRSYKYKKGKGDT